MTERCQLAIEFDVHRKDKIRNKQYFIYILFKVCIKVIYFIVIISKNIIDYTTSKNKPFRYIYGNKYICNKLIIKLLYSNREIKDVLDFNFNRTNEVVY